MYEIWWTFLVAVLIQLLLTVHTSQEKPERCQYLLTEINGCNKPNLLNSLSKSQIMDTENRQRRSTPEMFDFSSEFHKMKRRLTRVQSNLSKSIGDLSKQVLRSVRRVEDRLEQLQEEHQMKKKAQDHRNFNNCPKGFEYVGSWNSCYMLSNYNASWYDARDYCNALDSELVSLANEKEHNILTFLIKNSPVYNGVASWWMGGTFYDNTRQWMWMSETLMKPFTFIKWATGEPNEEMLQCVNINRDSDHLWHDDICTEKLNFICEVPRPKM